jgi:hypothetical protein
MKIQFSKKIGRALWAGTAALLIAAGIIGCGVNADAGRTAPQSFASNKTPTVTPQPGSREWNDANFGDSGL